MKRPSTAFWDTSAITPLCARELNSGVARTLARKFEQVVWWTTEVEVLSGISRLERMGNLGIREANLARAKLDVFRGAWREVAPSDRLRELATQSLQLHSLRAADSLQLAAALMWSQERPANRVFICADMKLSDAAEKAGFSVERL